MFFIWGLIPGLRILHPGPGSNMARTISGQIEYICGSRWNAEYNKWLVDFCKYKNHRDGFKYHYMSKVNWYRELTKLPKYCDWSNISEHPNIT